MPGVVHDDVEPAGHLDDPRDRRVDRRLVGDVELDHPRVDRVLAGVAGGVGGSGLVAAGVPRMPA